MEHNIKRNRLSPTARKAKEEKDKPKIAYYRLLTDELLSKKKEQCYTIEQLEKTTELLALNPEFYTIWNYRREILVELFKTGGLERKKSLENDLKLVMAQLKIFPKCYWIWDHRVWCLFQLQETHEANWEFEYLIVSKVLEMDSRNFHGWQYRRFVVENMENNTLATPIAENEKKLALLKINVQEFEYTTSKINRNISNFSAWHTRSKLVPKIYELYHELGMQTEELKTLNFFKTPYTLLAHELELIKTGMYMDAEDTSVWTYFFWLLTDELFTSYLKNNNSKGEPSYEEILQEQLKSVRELNELEKDDHPKSWDNISCLKSFILLENLIKIQKHEDLSLDDSTKQHLTKLMEYDPLRKGRYVDQLNGKTSYIQI